MRRAALVMLLCACGLAVGRHDIRMMEPLVPNGVVYGRWPVNPGVLVYNNGDSTEWNVPARVWIDSAGVRVYEGQSSSPGPVHPRMPAAFGGFPTWGFRPGYFTYDVTAIAELANDEDRSNDTARVTASVVLGQWRDTIECEGPAWADIDGSIGSWEWWWGYDISDSLGRAGAPRPMGSCLFHTGFESYLYMAVDVLALPTREDGDRLVVRMDENGDGVWSTDSSEGSYDVFVNGGVDSVVYSYLPGQQCPGALSASSIVNGNLQFEVAIPMGSGRSDITRPAGTSRAAISCWRRDSCYGWWPSSLELAHWDDPAYYAPFCWLIMPVEEGGASGTELVPAATSTIARGVLWLRDCHPVSAGETGGCTQPVLLDVSGRRVMELRPGPNDVSALSPGVYFVCPASGVPRSASRVSKVVIAR